MNATDLQHIVTDFAELPTRRDALLTALPGFLEKHFAGASVVSGVYDDGLRVLASSHPQVKMGIAPPDAEAARRAIRSGKCAQSVAADDLPGLTHSASWPLRERMTDIATLQVFSQEPLGSSTMVTLEVFSRLISSRLTESSRTREAAVLAELMVGFSSSESVDEGAALALDVLSRYSQAEAGYLLRSTSGTMQVLAHIGLEASPERCRLLGIDQPYPEGLAWQAMQTGRTQFAPTSVEEGAPPGGAVTALHPIGWRDTFRFVLVLRYLPPSLVTPADLDLFSALITQIQHGLERLQSDMVQDRLLILQAKIVDAASSDLFQLILDEALALVPGAGAGSLLARKNSSLPFRFRAVSGFDMTELRHVELSEAHIRNWYGLQSDSWRNGEPRELRRSVMSPDQLSGRSSEQTDGLPGTRFIQSSLCLPVSFRGEVLACLNLDNLQDEKAFAEDSVKVLRQFAPVISNLIGAASQFDRIVGLAHTDALTGLPNRRGGAQALDALVQDGQHGDEGFALLSMDLTGFKQVNDLYGHESGDEALIDVAAALSSAARSGDTVVRWGGDEFIVILPGADRSTGEHVARRLREAVSGIRIGDVSLGISIGFAVFPDDAEDASRLLQLADARMYREKQEQSHHR